MKKDITTVSHSINRFHSLKMAACCCSLFLLSSSLVVAQNEKTAVDFIAFDSQSHWKEMILTKENEDKNEYHVFLKTDSESCDDSQCTATLSFPSAVTRMDYDQKSECFCIIGDDFASISRDAKVWYITTDRVEPFVYVGSDGEKIELPRFSTKNIPNKPSYIPEIIPDFIDIGANN
jgi:hypothetical protein